MCVFKIQNTYLKLQTSEIALSRYISGNLVTIAKNYLALGSSDPLLKTMWTGSKEDQKWQRRSHLIGWLNVTSRHVMKFFLFRTEIGILYLRRAFFSVGGCAPAVSSFLFWKLTLKLFFSSYYLCKPMRDLDSVNAILINRIQRQNSSLS